MKMVPLAMTNVNWSVMIDFGKEVLGVSPTRGLDNNEIGLDSIASFLGALGFDNEPVKALREHKNFGHFSISFIGVFSTEDIIEIAGMTDLNMIAIDGKGKYKREKLAVFTASMDKWVQACHLLCDLDTGYGIRECFCDVTNRFLQNGFKEAFSQFERINLDDSTFSLRRK